jgi:hypothetical protein
MRNQTIEITPAQKRYLVALISADQKRMSDLSDHAIAHQTEIYLPYHQPAYDLIEKLNGES